MVKFRCGPIKGSDIIIMQTKVKLFPFAIVIATLLASVGNLVAEDWDAHGRVVDENGKPVAGASVAYFWSGNWEAVACGWIVRLAGEE